MHAVTFQLGQREGPGEGLRRIVLEQIDLAAGLVTHASPTEADIHEYRRVCRRVRAILRLVRGLDEGFYGMENAVFRDAARQVSPMRTVWAMAETVPKLVADGTLEGNWAEPLQQHVELAAVRVRAEILEVQGRLATTMTDARRRFTHWEIPGGLDPTSVGLEGTYAGGLRSMEKAYGEPSSRSFHEWRKRGKFLQHQVEVLSGSSGEAGDFAEALTDLSKGLGLHQDIADLSSIVGAAQSMFPGPGSQTRLIAALEARQIDLRADLRLLGEDCYAETPSQFVARMRQHWEDWRAAS